MACGPRDRDRNSDGDHSRAGDDWCRTSNVYFCDFGALDVVSASGATSSPAARSGFIVVLFVRCCPVVTDSASWTVSQRIVTDQGAEALTMVW